MKKLKVGLVGFGGMGGMHFSCYGESESAFVGAICDVRRDFALQKLGDLKIPVYTDLDEMLEKEKPDVVDLCTPSYLHAEMAIKCLNEGFNVLCEKPMTLTVADAEKVIAAAKKNNKKFMVAHVVRFMAQNVFLKKVIDSGELGKLLSLDMKRISYIPLWSWDDWMRDEKRSGGVCLDLSVHDIDFVQFALGMPDKIRSVYRPIKDNSSFIKTTMLYGDTVVTLEAGWYNTDIPFIADFLAVFDNGYVEYKNGKLTMNKKEVPLDEPALAKDVGINVRGCNAYADEINYFADCVKNDEEVTYVKPESSLESVKLALDIINEKNGL